MSTYSFTLPLAPVAWGRVKRGRYGNAYVPPKTLQFERQVAALAKRYAPPIPLKGAISVDLTFYVERPKRCLRTYPSVRPDLDNFIKGVTDALNGLFYEDDGQIVHLSAVKVYRVASGDLVGPCIDVSIGQLVEPTKERK